MENIFDMNNEQNQAIQPFFDLLNQIMAMEDAALTENYDMLLGMYEGAFTDTVIEQNVNQVLQDFKDANYSRGQVDQVITDIQTSLSAIIEQMQPSEIKRRALNQICKKIIDIYLIVKERYLTYDIVLPMTIGENGQQPKYAHATDAAADLYAAETITLAAHSLSNKIKTDVCIALPEGWTALIVPRSSIGAKTGLRLSNSIGVIDSEYRGELGILYDNISDSDYTINKGDRIAQLIITRCYQFQPQVVERLDETSRGENGFGSTGK